MQLTLAFWDASADEKINNGHCEDSYIQEFEQWNFSHVLRQTKYSAQELTHLLLTSKNVAEDLKIAMLKKMGDSIFYLEQTMDDEYVHYVRGHNNIVRSILKSKFDKEIYYHLKKNWLKTFKQYNDFYRKSYGGKSFQNSTVVSPDHEWHNEYSIRRKKRIQDCVSTLLISSLRNPLTILEYYMTVFSHKDIIEAVNAMELPSDKKKIILESVKSKEEKIKEFKKRIKELEER